MACFVVPTAEAIVTSIIKKAAGKAVTEENANKHPFIKRLGWLNNMLWGGSALLAFEHIWHGEVTPWAPFITAASNPAAASEMIHEMATSGVAMAALVTVAWAGMVMVSNTMEKRNVHAAANEVEAK
ncbi:MAG: hypothetical protein J1G06_05250 [Oscillospiraceae bacterium]|nr:hypothetical protein [Oscillospiraceae bacterium]